MGCRAPEESFTGLALMSRDCFQGSHPSACGSRRGISKIELLGCLIAVGGGVWIGAQYVGLNLQGAAYQALDEAELLTQIPEEWRPENPDCPDGDCPSPEDVRLERQALLVGELHELRHEVALLTGDAADGSDEAATLSEEDRRVRDSSQAYWAALSSVIGQVTKIQSRVSPYLGSEQHARALSARRRALEYGRSAVELLDTEGVDSEAVATGWRVAEWFGQGAETLQAALEIRSHQAIEGRSVSGSDVWANIEADLAKRTDLVRRKSRETAAYLSGRYFVEFPPLEL